MLLQKHHAADATAIVGVGSLLATQAWAGWLRYCGAHSFVIYLSFFLPMKIALKAFAATGVVPDVGTASALILVVAVATPLAFHWLTRDSWARFLYERPAALRMRLTQHEAREKGKEVFPAKNSSIAE